MQLKLNGIFTDDPGIGVGGHCIPVDPYYYIQFSETAGSKSMMSPIAEKSTSRCLNMQQNHFIQAPDRGGILILGTGYKPNVRDIRRHLFSPHQRVIGSRFSSAHGIQSIKKMIISQMVVNTIYRSLMYKGISMVHQLLIKCLSLDWGDY